MQAKYILLADAFTAWKNAVKQDNRNFASRMETRIYEIIKTMSHGSGVDGETQLRYLDSNENKLVIQSAYHHMNENGFYDGWTDFKIVLTPDWNTFNIEIVGNFPKKYADTREYLAELFYIDLIEKISIK